MTRELKPCPFCGGEGKLKVADGILDDFTMFYCYCPNGKCIAGGTDWFRSREEAIEVWNTRAERTCKMELVKRGPIYSVWRFSCCGYVHSENRTDGGATELPGTRCPKCGAVVDNER